MLYREDLEATVRRGCSDPLCDHKSHDQLFFAPACHRSSGLALTYSPSNGLRAACLVCGKTVLDVAAAKPKQMKSQCHPNAGVCISYRPNSSKVKITCRKCDKVVCSVKVKAGSTSPAYPGKPDSLNAMILPDEQGQSEATDLIPAIADAKPGEKIKVHMTFANPSPPSLAGEYLWGTKIANDTAKIVSIPFCTARVASGSPVRFDDIGEILEVLERAARTRGLIYADEEEQTIDEIEERFTQVCEKLKEYDIQAEGMFPGICSISVPLDLDDEQLEILADQLDAKLILHEDEEE